MASSVSWILVTSPLLWLLFASSFAAGETSQRGVPKSTAGGMIKVQATGAHLTADDTILDLLNHPAFAGSSQVFGASRDAVGPARSDPSLKVDGRSAFSVHENCCAQLLGSERR
jgi:hypothetical protein